MTYSINADWTACRTELVRGLADQVKHLGSKRAQSELLSVAASLIEHVAFNYAASREPDDTAYLLMRVAELERFCAKSMH